MFTICFYLPLGMFLTKILIHKRFRKIDKYEYCRHNFQPQNLWF